MEQIDHTEIFVLERFEAAQWYQRVLGPEIVVASEHWAAVPTGPPMISSDGGGKNYFCDKYGNRLEVTTYDHDRVRLQRRK